MGAAARLADGGDADPQVQMVRGGEYGRHMLLFRGDRQTFWFPVLSVPDPRFGFSTQSSTKGTQSSAEKGFYKNFFVKLCVPFVELCV